MTHEQAIEAVVENTHICHDCYDLDEIVEAVVRAYLEARANENTYAKWREHIRQVAAR